MRRIPRNDRGRREAHEARRKAALVGMPPARSCLDLTALWYKEVDLVGSYAYGVEQHEGEQTTSFQLALRLAPEVELETMVGPRFRLADYREAIAAAALQAERATSGGLRS